MIKKIIVTLTIIITLMALITPKALAGDTIEIPNSTTDPDTAFNQLLEGEATVTSDDDGSSVQSQVVGVGQSETLLQSLVGAFVSATGLIPDAISRLLSAVALGDRANMEDNAQLSDFFTIGDLLTNKYPLFNINLFEETPSGPNSELSNTIKDNVSIWYVTIRNIAAAACAVTLLYVGIRMAISTTAEDTAKYKKMLMSWVIGAILLFVIHYIILIMMKLNEIFVGFITNAVEQDTNITAMEEAMLTIIPQNTAKAEGWGKLVYLVMNFVMLFYELKFFIMYLFRVLNICIMTIISPLICVTYPIDAMGDGRAQGFNNWFRRIMMEILIQPIHLIIYLIFIYSAGEIATEAPLIGIIFIIALDYSERIVKNAFKLRGGKGLREIKMPWKS